MVQNQSPKRVIVSESSSALSIKNDETYTTIQFILKQDELTVENKQAQTNSEPNYIWKQKTKGREQWEL